MDRLDKSTILLVLVLLLQVFRRLNAIIYTCVLLASYLYWITSISFSRKIKIKTIGLLFLLTYFILPIFSLFVTQTDDYISALIRYGALFPFIVINILNPQIIYKNIRSILKIYCLVVFASALLMIYQIFAGKISFFDDTSGRLGYERYGSLLGSTTIYGTASLVAIMILYDFNIFKVKTSKIIESIIIIGGILCLSKSFFVNIVITYILIFIFHSKDRFNHISMIGIIKATIAIFIIVVTFIIVIRYTFVGKYFNDMINYTFSESDLGVESSFFDRLVTLPQKAFNFYNYPYIYYLIIGVGFRGYAGTLGIHWYPMCHNNYCDIILSQGCVTLIIIMSIYLTCFKLLFKSKTQLSCFIKQLIIFILINMTAGVWAYLTTIGAVFLCIIYSVLNYGGSNDKNIYMYSNMEQK